MGLFWGRILSSFSKLEMDSKRATASHIVSYTAVLVSSRNAPPQRGGGENERYVTRQKWLRGDDNEIQYNTDLKVY